MQEGISVVSYLPTRMGVTCPPLCLGIGIKNKVDNEAGRNTMLPQAHAEHDKGAILYTGDSDRVPICYNRSMYSQ